jgi:photosystem II stability/assembly factor-like uncharacterized protein
MYRSILTLLLILVVLTAGNAQWQILNQSGFLNVMDFVDSETGWLAGNGSIMKTEDGGTTWISIFNNDNLIIGMIDFVNRSTGWMVSYDNSGGGGMVVSKSTDGGHNWIDQYDIPEYWIRSIKTVNDTTVFVLGDTLLLKSSDGGFTWKDITVELADRRFSAFCFVNGDSGVIIA